MIDANNCLFAYAGIAEELSEPVWQTLSVEPTDPTQARNTNQLQLMKIIENELGVTAQKPLTAKPHKKWINGSIQTIPSIESYLDSLRQKTDSKSKIELLGKLDWKQIQID